VIEATRFGGPEVLAVTELPDPTPGPGQMVVAVTASDVLFVDTMIRGGRGVDFFPIRPPYVPGGGVGGTVVSVGVGVDGHWLGQPVIAHTGDPSGTGGYAERAVVSSDDAVPVPDGVDLLDAVAVLHDGPTALRITRLAGVTAGETVLVLGAAGGMGVLLLQLLRGRGARVIGAARGKVKLDVVAEAGADAAVDYGRPTWTDDVLHLTDGTRPDVVLDGVGGPLGRQAYQVMADGGRFSAHGAPSGSFAPIDPDDARRRGVTLSGIRDLQATPDQRTALAGQILSRVRAGDLTPLIGQAFPLASAAEAHSTIEARATIAKTLLIA